MDKRLEPIPIDVSKNGSKIRTFEFEEADALMIVKALSIAINTAMMGGGQQSIGRLRYYKQKMMSHVPEGGTLFKRDTDLSEIAICSTAAPTWSHYRIKEREWSNRFRGVIMVGTRKFGSGELFESEELFQKMISAASALIDINCQYTESPDVVGNIWSI